jgi:hypothetical protein
MGPRKKGERKSVEVFLRNNQEAQRTKKLAKHKENHTEQYHSQAAETQRKS